MDEFRIVKAVTENPFYVLAVRPECSRQEFEREGQKLLSMLDLNLPEARSYPTPLGDRARSPELVRVSMAELRDPSKRLIHELFATLSPLLKRTTESNELRQQERWYEAPSMFGCGREREPEK